MSAAQWGLLQRENRAIKLVSMKKTPARRLARRQTKSLVPKRGLPTGDLLQDIRELIVQAREQTARAVNSALVGLYWRIGKRIREDVLQSERAEYGKQVVSALSAQLTLEFGPGFGISNLSRMMALAEKFPDERIVATLSQQLGWSHFVEIIVLDDPLKREFYAELCRVERWSVRRLRSNIDRLLYERTAVSKQPEEVVRRELAALREEDRLSPELVFRDPYFLDFLGLTDAYEEKDLERAILRELEKFLLELGGDFAFVARQKRISIDGDDYYLDLLFFHRRLSCLLAIDLKLGRFQAGDKGQMELYLNWLAKHEQRPEEQPPIGLILCADKSEEHVELLQLHNSRIRVAQYLTELPPRKLLEKKLHEAILIAKEKLALNSSTPYS